MFVQCQKVTTVYYIAVKYTELLFKVYQNMFYLKFSIIIVAFLQNTFIEYSSESVLCVYLSVCVCLCVCVFIHDNSNRNLETYNLDML